MVSDGSVAKFSADTIGSGLPLLTSYKILGSEKALRQNPALTEGTANFLVNRRMNKSQQMRWSRRGADPLLQVRCAVLNDKLRLRTAVVTNPRPEAAMAA
jgi:hypothetical protein